MKKKAFILAAVVTLLGSGYGIAYARVIEAPEPGTLMLLGAGLVGLLGTGVVLKRRKK